jgi:AcrR family transcriptional regulator
MKISADAKAATRRRLLDVARGLLEENGWNGFTTRDIATTAGVANGTMFNYFPTKEALLGALISETVANAAEELAKRRKPTATLEEDLFSFIWRGLRHLLPLRALLPAGIVAMIDDARIPYVDAVERVLARHDARLSAVEKNLIWALYSGVLAFWLKDESPKQEETLALLDRTTRLIAASLQESEEHS